MTKHTTKQTLLYKFNNNETTTFEICLDEVGRGPLFGRVYVAGVVLPNNPELFNGEDVKDSKKFSSKQKMKKVAEHIKEHCLAYHIDFAEASVIDEINILQSVYRCMHKCVHEIIKKLTMMNGEHDIINNLFILVDGNSFSPFCLFDENAGEMKQIPHETVEKGDATFMGIASASIIAKVAHDEYIYDLCEKHPSLHEKYDLLNNVGYGTKKHLEGIHMHGISEFHRKTFGICRSSIVNSL